MPLAFLFSRKKRREPCPLPFLERKKESHALCLAILEREERAGEERALPSALLFSRERKRKPCPLPSAFLF